MKLGALNAAIDAAPAVWVRYSFDGTVLDVEQKKGSLKAALAARFSGRAAETGLALREHHGRHFLYFADGRP